MPFPGHERDALLAVKGVGSTVVARLEQMGFACLRELAGADASEILRGGAALTGSSCWNNSPQARDAVRRAIDMARRVSVSGTE